MTMMSEYRIHNAQATVDQRLQELIEECYHSSDWHGERRSITTTINNVYEMGDKYIELVKTVKDLLTSGGFNDRNIEYEDTWQHVEKLDRLIN